jgi:predicted peptidase
MGLSMGGMGTYELLARQPQTFAAAVPICGGTNPALVPIYGPRVPLWIFHGAVDGVVDVVYSRRVVAALHQLGVKTRYTEYPDVGHGSWDPAFAEPELLEWLFSHRRQQ